MRDGEQVIVGFVGKIGSGKTTAAKCLEKRFGFERFRFASPLKAMLAAMGLSSAELDGHLKEEPSELLCGKTPRWAMQSLGTEWGRNLIGQDIWLNAWCRAIEGSPLVVVDDVRFDTEAKAIHDAGGLLIRVIRPGTDGGDKLVHASEVQNFPVDATVINDGSLFALEHKVCDLVQPRLDWRRVKTQYHLDHGRVFGAVAIMTGDECVGTVHSEALAQQIVDDLNRQHA